MRRVRRGISENASTKASLIGIYSALRFADDEWAAILACDLPFVSERLIDHLASRVSEKVDAVVPLQADGRTQPLCAIYNAARCVPVIEEMIDRGDLKMQVLLSRITVKFVLFNELLHLEGAHHFFVNINRPEDLERARSIRLQAAP